MSRSNVAILRDQITLTYLQLVVSKPNGNVSVQTYKIVYIHFSVCIPVMSELQQPVNLTVTSAHFNTMLKWEPGPEMPEGVNYNVTFNTDRWVSSVFVF